MSDYKSGYSDESKNYIGNKVPNSELDQGRYNRSKDREVKFNTNWLRRPATSTTSSIALFPQKKRKFPSMESN